jgi:peptidoglycan/xylan/chitin deacetylase (PgdA/CDA1 family)
MLPSKGEFWWDELDRLFLQPNPLPETLQLKVNGTTYRWELGKTAHYNKADFLRQRHWKAWEDAPTARHALYRSLWEVLQPLPEQKRRAALDHLYAWADAAPIQRETHRTLSIPEALTLAKGGLIEIGAHTVTHPALSALPVDCQWHEIQQSKTHLEDLLDTEIVSFSYPYGRPSDYTGETVRLVREAGFTCACANSGGLVRQSTERFQLPRVHVSDGDGEQFDQWLRRQFNE